MRTDFYHEAIIAAILAANAESSISTAQELVSETRTDTMQSIENILDANTLEKHLISLLDAANKNAVLYGVQEEFTKAADFAVCAFIDETLLSAQTWQGRAQWMLKPLQFSRHGTATAGEEFYTILQTLLSEAQRILPQDSAPPLLHQDTDIVAQEESSMPLLFAATPESQASLRAVLEVFALCLAQGFTGMHYGNSTTIREYIERISHFVPSVAEGDSSIIFTPKDTVKPSSFFGTKSFFRRFDVLDVILWAIPLTITISLYIIGEMNLDTLLQPLLEGTTQP